MVLAAAALAATPAAPALADHHAAAGSADAFIHSVEKTHGESAWDAHSGFTSRFKVDFGEMIQLEGQMTFDTAVGRSVMQLDNGVTIVNDGTTCWVSPPDAPLPPGMARFQSLTWPYFLAMPFKLDDRGAKVEPAGEMPWENGQPQESFKLTFGEGVGDAPEDWYFLFRDGEGRLVGTSYIVTYLAPKAEAEADPHAAVFGGFEEVQGAVIPTDWSFHGWTKDGGLQEQQIGSVTLTEPRFLEVDDATFAKPSPDARVDEPL